MLRRIERALLGGDVRSAGQPLRAGSRALAAGCLLAAIAVAGCAALALMQPQPAVDSAPIVMGRQSGALYVWVDDTLHPVLNLASARLIAATAANPRPVREADLSSPGRARRGPPLGIPGAPQLLGAALPDTGTTWAVCDSARDAAGGTAPMTTVVVGDGPPGPGTRSVDPEQPVLVTSGAGPETRTYLLYRGRRVVVDLADPAAAPRRVSALLVNAIPEAPPTAVPARPVAGAHAPLTGAATLCVQWSGPAGSPTDVTLVAGAGLPLPAGQAPVALAQADGEGPALDAVYLPPGRSAYVRTAGVSGQAGGARYLITDTGVRFVVDDDAARSLGLPATPAAAPWPVLAGLPAGPRLNRRNALVARDVIGVDGAAGIGRRQAP